MEGGNEKRNVSFWLALQARGKSEKIMENHTLLFVFVFPWSFLPKFDSLLFPEISAKKSRKTIAKKIVQIFEKKPYFNRNFSRI